jgi:Anti-sigma-K factor rskA
VSEFQLPDQPVKMPAGPDNGASGPSHIDPEDLTLFAMQLLSGEDAAAISAHLDACAECRDELARIRGDLAVYAIASETASPPASARQRLMDQIARDKGVVPFPQPVGAARPAPAAATAATEDPPALTAFGRHTSILESDDDEPETRYVGRTLLGWAGWAIAAGLAFFAFTLHKDRDSLRENLSARSSQIQRLNTDAASAHQLMDALTDPTAVRVTLTTKPPAKAVPIGGITYNPAKGSLVFLASNLDPLQLDKTYELWLIPADGGAPIPAGTFHPDAEGNASLIMPDLPKGVAAKAFGVTVEDDGGAQTPTLPIVMAGSA